LNCERQASETADQGSVFVWCVLGDGFDHQVGAPGLEDAVAMLASICFDQQTQLLRVELLGRLDVVDEDARSVQIHGAPRALRDARVSLRRRLT
jgi:hypothetical protein